MSDPLERLREAPLTPPRPPDVNAIRVRARQIDSRRRLTIASVVGSVLSGVVVLAVVLALHNGPRIPVEVERIPGQLSNPGGPTPGPTVAPGDNIASSAAQGQGVASGPEATKTTGPLRVRIEASSATVSQGGSVTLRVSACNVSAEPVVRNFNSGQRYEFEVVQGDNVLWQWGKAKQFTRFSGREIWQPRECRSFAEDWTGVDSGNVPLAPGRYAVRARITATDPAQSGVTSVCVGPCP